MKCFNCGKRKTKTIYPTDGKTKYVQKKCLTCGWKSYPVKINKIAKPEKKETYKKRNIFDIYEGLI